jgi:hypothetical protein
MSICVERAHSDNLPGSRSRTRGSGHCLAQRSRLSERSASHSVQWLTLLTRNILVTAKRGSDESSVRKSDAVLGSGWVQALQEGDGRVEDNFALAASVGTDVDLISIGKFGLDTTDVGRAVRVQVDRTEERAELMRLNLNKN